MPVKSGIPLLPEDQGDMPDRSPNHTEPQDPSFALQANRKATSPERQRDTRGSVAAFTQTVASTHPSLVLGPSPPDLPAVAARFLQSAQDPSQRSSSSAPSRLDPTSGSPGTHPCPPASSISLKLDGTGAVIQPRSWRGTLGNRRPPVVVACHGHTFGTARAWACANIHRTRGTTLGCQEVSDPDRPLALGSSFDNPHGPCPCPMRPRSGLQPSHSGPPATSRCLPAMFFGPPDPRTPRGPWVHGLLPKSDVQPKFRDGQTLGYTDPEPIRTQRTHAACSDTDDARTNDPCPVLALPSQSAGTWCGLLRDPLSGASAGWCSFCSLQYTCTRFKRWTRARYKRRCVSE